MATEILRPAAAGYLMSLSKYPSGNSGFDCIDEETLDNTDYVYWPTSPQSEGWCFFTLSTPSDIQPGDTINSVTVFSRHRRMTYSGATYTKGKLAIYIGETRYEGSYFTPVYDNYTKEYSLEYLTNPFTGAAWTYDDLLELQAGVLCKAGNTYEVRCAQAWVVIDYTPGTSGYTLTAIPGNFTLTGTKASLLKSKLLNVINGSFSLQGQPVNLWRIRELITSPGSLHLPGELPIYSRAGFYPARRGLTP